MTTSGNPMSGFSIARQRRVKKLLRDEFTKFFVTMTTAQDNTWPSISDQEFVDALADSLMEMGRTRNLGIAYAQTLVHELQDRINQAAN